MLPKHERYMTTDIMSLKEDALEAENTGLRRLLAQAGIDATAHEVAD
jgi:hypothetical protein